jgi:hypothetical protein
VLKWPRYYGISGSLRNFIKVDSFFISEQNLGALWKNHDDKFCWASSEFLCCPIKVEVSFHFCPNIGSGFRVEVSFSWGKFSLWAL